MCLQETRKRRSNKERCLAFKFYGNHVVKTVMSLKQA